jgi:hypothetical protein
MEDNQGKRRTFTHWHWLNNFDGYEWVNEYEMVLVVVELLDGLPVASYIVPATKPFVQCGIYPYIRN